jgi:hypothetical protein
MFNSDRLFVVHSYSASHGLLLLRSRKTPALPTRIDVLFQDVRAMELRCWFDGIAIDEVPDGFLADFASKPRELVEAGNKIYKLTGKGWCGYVVAGIVRTHEDDGEWSAPSALMAH